MADDSNESRDSTSSTSDSFDSKKHRSHRRHHGKHKTEEKKKKKHKKKSSKKSKKHEHRSRSDSSRKKRRGRRVSVEEEEEEEVFGPALPPHLHKPTLIGPEMPKNAEDLERLMKSREEEEEGTSVVEATNNSKEEEEEMDSEEEGEMFGPLPPPGHSSRSRNSELNSKDQELSGKHRLLEERALELKMASIDGCFPTQNQSRDVNEREEWMMELPEVGLRRNLRTNGGTANDILNLLKRGFHQGKEKPDFEDRSEWTKTPDGEGGSKKPKRSKAQSPTSALKKEAMETEAKRRDQEQEMLAKKYRHRDRDGKRVKTEESLYEQHQRRLREEEEERRKRPAERVERRPFNRDIDLKLVKIDRNQTKQIVKNAKLLDSKFSTGQTKYL